MHKLFKPLLILLPIISLLSVLKIYSDLTEYQKSQKTKEILFDIRYKISEFKSISTSDLNANQLNLIYNVNKRFIDILGKNFLENELLDARDYIKKKKNKNKVVELLADALRNLRNLESSVEDPLIKSKFLQLQNEINRIKDTQILEEKSKRINEVIEDIEYFKNELLMQRRVKLEGSKIINSFNQVAQDLDQILLIINPLLKYKMIDEQLKVGINKMYAEIAEYQAKNQTQSTFIHALNFIAFFVLFLSLFVAIVLFKYNFSRKQYLLRDDREDESAKNSFDEEAIDLKLKLEILQENLSQYFAVINKDGVIGWCSRDFLNFFAVNNCEKLAQKYFCSTPIWDEIQRSFIKNNDNSWSLSPVDKRSFFIKSKKINSLKYTNVIVLTFNNGNEDAAQPPYVVDANSQFNTKSSYVELCNLCIKWVSQNECLLNEMQIPIAHVNLKKTNDTIYVNANNLTLQNLLQKTFEIISIYFWDNPVEDEIFITCLEIKRERAQIQCFIPALMFGPLNESVVKKSKVYPAISTCLRNIESELQELQLEVFLKNVYTRDKKLKGGMLVLEFSKQAIPGISQTALKNVASF